MGFVFAKAAPHMKVRCCLVKTVENAGASRGATVQGQIL